MTGIAKRTIRTLLFLLALFVFVIIAIAMRPPGPLEVGLILVIILSVFLYLLPTIIALIRQKLNRLTVFLINFFLGWSLIGWIFALILSISKDTEKSRTDQTVIVSQNIEGQTKNDRKSTEQNKNEKYLEIAKERFAKGEIDQKQYEQIKKEFS